MTAGTRPAAGAHEALVGYRLAAQLRLHPGAPVTIAGSPYRVAGIYHTGVLFEDSGRCSRSCWPSSPRAARPR